ncbi:MAG: LptA/OstA family protein [Pseudomonadota bacterium]
MRSSTLAKLSACYAAGGFALGLALMAGMDLSAQGRSNTGIAAHNTRAPVNIDAGTIELQDRANRVAFSGDVIVTQADLTVRSARMVLNYLDEGSLELQRLTAVGGVTVTRGSERASGDSAVYDFNRRIITLAGNVRLKRGSDTLNGGRLVIDLQSGLSSVDGKSAGGSGEAGSGNGRVTGTFSVPQGEDEDQKEP